MKKSFFEILNFKNYRNFIFGQIISNLGRSINYIGLAIYTLKFSNPFLGLGTLMILQQLPIIFFGPFAGVIAEKLNKKKILVISDVLRGILSILLFVNNSIFLFYLIIFIMSCITALFNPTVNGLFPKILPREKLALGNSVYNTLDEFVSLVGPTIGGILTGVYGSGIVFLINGITHFIASGFSIKLDIDGFKKEKASFNLYGINFKRDIKDGIDYVRNDPIILFILIFFAIATAFFAGMPLLYYNYILFDLSSSEQIFGLFNTLAGVGGLLGAMLVPYLIESQSKLSIMTKYLLIYGTFFIVFSIVKYIPLNLAIFLFIGIIIGIVNTTYGIFLQTYVEENYVSRVYSLDMSLSTITSIVGLLTFTFIGDLFITQHMLLMCSISLVIIGLIGFTIYNKLIKERK